MNSIVRFLKLRYRLFGNFQHCVVLLVMMVSPFLFSFPAARAEEKKSLEELLVDKGVVTQDEVAGIQGRKFAKWVDRIIFSGDLRLRHDSIMRDLGPGSPATGRDNHQDRFRLRLGTEFKIGDFYVGARIASGTGSQVATNQTFDNLFSQKQLWIDQAYLQWKALSWLSLTAGKMPNPFYNIPDVIWDVDTNPEGFSQTFQLKVSDSLALFANTAQFVLDEDRTDNNDQWLFGEQGGIQVGIGNALQVTLAGAFYNFKNATVGNFGQVTVQNGNTRVATPPVCGTGVAVGTGGCVTATTDLVGRLANSYRILDLATEITVKIGTLPISFIGDYVKNLADTSTDKDTGYQVGGRIGKASDPQSWEIAYFYKLMETDATLADLTDSDFGDGGTNQKGHITWVAYQFNKAIWGRMKYVTTKVEDESLPPGKYDVKRIQFDLITKF